MDGNLKRSRATCGFFSQKLVELGWLYKQVWFKKFCMSSFWEHVKGYYCRLWKIFSG